MLKLALIIPAYNEERRIENTLVAYENYFEKLRKKRIVEYAFLVVINESSDKTKEIVEKIGKRNSRIKYINLAKRGKGLAVTAGFKECVKGDFDLIGFVDADMATSPQEFWKLVNRIGKHDASIADRYLKNSKILPKPSINRLLARKLFNFVIRIMLFLPIGDTQCGAKVFKKQTIEKILPSLSFSKWAFDVDILYQLKKNGFKIKPVETVWEDKEYSKINFWQTGPWMALAVFRLRLLNSPFRGFVRIYDKLLGYVPK